METPFRTDESHWLDTAFLSENPESFGQVADARPIATHDLLVAVNGYVGGDGSHTPAFTVEEPGIYGLLEEVYGDILPPTEENLRVLRHTFGESDVRQDHLISRYCAVLAQAEALNILRGEGAGKPYERVARLLTKAIPASLQRLRTAMQESEILLRGDDDLFSVSLGACRIRHTGHAAYEVDIFSAGDFGFYLLDEYGMAPLWQNTSPVLSPDSEEWVTGHTVTVEHTGPFAVVMLSHSLCGEKAAEGRGGADAPGRKWRHRMRLEEQLLRVITSVSQEEDFGARAARVYAGHAAARDCGTGCLTYRRGSYENFRMVCQNRLQVLEDLIAMLPDGYDLRYASEQRPLAEVEADFVRYAFKSRPKLQERAVDALSAYALRILEQGGDSPDLPPPVNDVPRLTYKDVHEVFRIYDRENDADHAQIRENRKVMHRLLGDHWITLRPVLCPEEACDETDPAYAASCDRAYASCLRMNGRLSRLLNKRRRALDDMERLLSDSLDMLRAESSDWLYGRAGDHRADLWMRELDAGFTHKLAVMEKGWREESERCRSLQSAYTAERELLFERDIHPERGCWRSTYEAVLSGRLPRGTWNLYAERAETAREAVDGGAGYDELLLVLRTVSENTRVLRERIEARAVERHMVIHISGDSEWQTACLRGVLCEDPAWAPCAEVVTDESFRNEYRATVRRWEETCNLIKRQEVAFEGYYDMYTTYVITDDDPFDMKQ